MVNSRQLLGESLARSAPLGAEIDSNNVLLPQVVKRVTGSFRMCSLCQIVNIKAASRCCAPFTILAPSKNIRPG
jgi:hypothetical protein